jgi:hypothetical protein
MRFRTARFETLRLWESRDSATTKYATVNIRKFAHVLFSFPGRNLFLYGAILIITVAGRSSLPYFQERFMQLLYVSR